MNKFLEKNGGWLLAIFSSIGVVLTSVLAAKEAPKAQEAIAEEERRRMEAFMTDAQAIFSNDPELQSVDVPDISLTTWEKVKIATPIMLPSLISGGLTIGGIITNQALNAKQQNVLAMAAAGYSVLSNEYDQYRRVIRETKGPETDETALRMAKMRCEELEDELARMREENGPYLYAISTIPGLIFEAKPADIQEAFLHFNRNLILRGTNDLAELYDFIGIPMTEFDKDDSFRYGWNEYENQIAWESSFVDFDIEQVETVNGTPVRLITMPIVPYDLTVDYSNENIMDHEYPIYNSKKTRDYITGSFDISPDRIVKIEHPYIYRTGLI